MGRRGLCSNGSFGSGVILDKGGSDGAPSLTSDSLRSPHRRTPSVRSVGNLCPLAGDQREGGFVENLHLAVPEPHQVLFFKLPEDPVDAGPAHPDEFGGGASG
jgi:hypothetical protein